VLAAAPRTGADPLPADAPAPVASGLDPETVKEGGFAVDAAGQIVVKEFGVLAPAPMPKSHVPRVKALIGLRDGLAALRTAERTGAADAEAQRAALRRQWEAFTKQYGPLNLEKRSEQQRRRPDGTTYTLTISRRPNLDTFDADPDAPAVAALEHYDGEALVPPTTSTPADILLRPTGAFAARDYSGVRTAVQALPVSMAEKGRVDLAFMAELTGRDEGALVAELVAGGHAFRDPAQGGKVEPADLYLSGNVRVKLAQAREAAKADPSLAPNVAALEAVQPVDLAPSQITAPLGSSWMPPDVVADFAQATLGLTASVRYSRSQATWSVDVRAGSTSAANRYDYGTTRITGHGILMDTLKGVRVKIEDNIGTSREPKYVLNLEETEKAQAKQKALEEAWAKWLWADDARSARLAALYNETFNSLRWPEVDGSALELPGTASHIGGRPFEFNRVQKNAIYRAVTRGSTLFAHVVGAGKTFTMIAAGMESRRLGLAKKPLYAVPNHMLRQFSNEFLQLYPNARILVATEEDFAKANRKRFVAKAANNEYDAVIMTHSSFGKVGMSPEFERRVVQEELTALREEMTAAKKDGDRTITKQLAAAEERLNTRLTRLAAQQNKDADFLKFEDLGVDQLFVDELHLFKNLYAVTKMRGLPVPASQRAFDMYLKSRYLGEINPTHGFFGATGTPISNSLVEMFTMQRYFRPGRLQALGIAALDGWFKTFGRVVSSPELSPSGGGYILKERPASFQNLPELGLLFREFADVRMEDEVFPDEPGKRNPRPPIRGGAPINVTVSPTLGLLAYTRWLIGRGEKVKGKKPEKGADNILKIFTEGRTAATALRLLARLAPTENPKIDALIERVTAEYQASTPLLGTQLIFSDVGTPKGSGSTRRAADPEDDTEGAEAEDDGGDFEAADGYTVYDDLKERLVAAGIPAGEIAYIHDAKNAAQKQRLFQAVKAGAVRVLIGSSEKMGAGTNVQDRIVALHNLDTPRSMRPADLEQREGRAIRQGNKLWNPGPEAPSLIEGVAIYRYATERSMEANLWDMLTRKAKMVGMVMRGDPNVREMEDLDSQVRDLETMKALSSGNPLIMERVSLEKEVTQLQAAERGHRDEIGRMRTRRRELLGITIPARQKRIAQLEADAARAVDTTADKFAATVGAKRFSKREDAGKAILNAAALLKERVASVGSSEAVTGPQKIGTMAGFDVVLRWSAMRGAAVGFASSDPEMPAHEIQSTIGAETTPLGVVAALEAIPRGFEARAAAARAELAAYEKDAEAIGDRLGPDGAGPAWDDAPKLAAKLARLAEVRAATAEETAKVTYVPLADENSGAFWSLVREGVFPYDERPVEAPKPAADTADTADIDEDSDEDDDPEGSGVVASFLGLGHLAAAIGRARRAGQPAAPALVSADATVEARWRAAKGLPPGVNDRTLREWLADVRHGFTRHYPDLDTAESPALAASADVLRRVEAAPAWAKAAAVDMVRSVVAPTPRRALAPGQVDVLTRVLALRDLTRDLEEGRYGEADAAGVHPKALPFGYPDAGAVAADLAAAEAAAAADARIAPALARRAAMARQVTERLVALDLLGAAALRDDRYYHRQVMEYAVQKRGTGTSRSDVRNRTQGFQRGRTGGGDFNTAYQEAEFEWLAQALTQIATAEAQREIRALADVRGRLVREAKAANEQTVFDVIQTLAARSGSDPAAAQQLVAWGIGDQDAVDDPLKRYRVRIGFGFSTLYEALRDPDFERTLTTPLGARLARVVDALRDEHAAWEAAADGSPFRFSHPALFDLLSALAGEQGDAARGAAMVLKAIHEREAFVEAVAGARHVTWEDVVPEGYAIWQPEEGNVFYRAATIDEAALAAALAGQGLDPGAVRMALVQGGPKQQWVIPEGLAATLDALRPVAERNALDSAWSQAQGTWKQWVLLSPMRAIKYNLNNLSGDADVVMGYDPRIFRYAPQALRDIVAVARGTASEAVRDELRTAMRRRVLDSGLSVNEIPDLSQVAAFRGLTNYAPTVMEQTVGRYWNGVRAFTNTRENVLRLAAYRHFRAELVAGRRLYGASKRHEVDAIRDPGERAAKLAAELIGDYGAISQSGQWLRKHLIPFYSWLEINAPRYVRVLRNAAHEGRAGGAAARLAPAAVARASLGVAGAAVRINAFLLLAALYNAWRFPDEEEELRREGRSAHIILGRTADGKIRTLRFEGAWADALEWAALGDYPADVRDLIAGSATLADKAAEAVKAPVERIAQAWEPMSKTLFELGTGRTLFPRMFAPGTSFGVDARPIRDRVEYAAGAVSLRWLYQRVTDRPLPPSSRGLNGFLGTLVYSTDPGEAAYWHVKDRVQQFQRKAGKPGAGGNDPSDRSDALLYFRMAARWGDEAAAQRWLQRYYALGGTRKTIRGSIKKADPLGALGHDRRAFLRSLSPQEREAVALARRWYRAQVAAPMKAGVRGQPLPTRPVTPPLPALPGAGVVRSFSSPSAPAGGPA
jgi:N12 class adenine-specific DNA methylase